MHFVCFHLWKHTVGGSFDGCSEISWNKGMVFLAGSGVDAPAGLGYSCPLLGVAMAW